MYTVPAEEGPRLGWGQIMFISSTMLLISLVIWGEVRADHDPRWQQTTYWEQQVYQQTPLGIIGVEVSLVLLVLRGRIRGWSNRALQRLLSLLVAAVIVGPLGYVTWSNIVLSRFVSS